jgi:hypothetical protein
MNDASDEGSINADANENLALAKEITDYFAYACSTDGGRLITVNDGFVVLTSNGRTLHVSAYVTRKSACTSSNNGDSAVPETEINGEKNVILRAKIGENRENRA